MTAAVAARLRIQQHPERAERYSDNERGLRKSGTGSCLTPGDGFPGQPGEGGGSLAQASEAGG